MTDSSGELLRSGSPVSASLDDVAAIASALPGVAESAGRMGREWRVGTRMFAWERPFSKADIKRFGDETPPSGPILGVRVDDLADKEAVLAAGTPGVFTIPHFDGYAAVLIQLDAIAKRALRAAVEDAWAADAPATLLAQHRAAASRRVPERPASSR